MPSAATRLLFKILNYSGRSAPTYAGNVLAIPNIIGYWKLNETSGTTAANSTAAGSARDGSYTSVTLAQITGPSAGMGQAGLWNGTSSTVNIFTASLGGAINGDAGTLALWIKVLDSSIWSGTTRFASYLEFADANNQVGHYLAATNTINGRRRAAASTENSSRTTSTTAWFHFAVTWDKAAGQLYTYLDGVQSTVVAISATMSGSLAVARIGSAAVSSFWSGYLAHAVIASRALTQVEITKLATAV